jgi:FixJ family two-component response regulator
VEVRVADDGQGIDASDLRRIFDPFFTRSPDGTGLGLTIVRRIIDQHHGSIRVESEPGAGNHVRSADPGEATGTGARAATSMKYEILVVDDEPLVRSSLGRLLDGENWRVTNAASGAAALRALEARVYDVAIIDYRLGDITGMNVLDALREKSPATMAIMLTAYGSVDLAVEALKKGAYDFLQKDADPQVTRHVVEKALEKARLRKELEQLQARAACAGRTCRRSSAAAAS